MTINIHITKAIKKKGLLTRSTNYKHILLRYPHALFCLQWFAFKIQNLYLTNQEFFLVHSNCEMEHSSSPTKFLHFSILFPSSPSLCCRLFPVHIFLPSIIFFHFSSLIVDLIYLSISPLSFVTFFPLWMLFPAPLISAIYLLPYVYIFSFMPSYVILYLLFIL